MKEVPANGSQWINRRTGEVCTVEYHVCGPAAGISVSPRGYGKGHMYTSDDSDESFTSRFKAIGE